MPAVTPLKLEHQLSSMSMTTSTTTKDAPSTPDTALITPTKSEAGGDLSFDTHEDSSQEEEAETPPSSVIQVYQKTDHKLLEEQGKFADEPLLKENPQRFVIFPIQDNDVSLKRLCIALYCIALCGVPLHDTCTNFILTATLLLPSLALGNVQKGRSFLLDIRRD